MDGLSLAEAPRGQASLWLFLSGTVHVTRHRFNGLRIIDGPQCEAESCIFELTFVSFLYWHVEKSCFKPRWGSEASSQSAYENTIVYSFIVLPSTIFIFIFILLYFTHYIILAFICWYGWLGWEFPMSRHGVFWKVLPHIWFIMRCFRLFCVFCEKGSVTFNWF